MKHSSIDNFHYMKLPVYGAYANMHNMKADRPYPNRLKELRLAADLTQQDIANLWSCDPPLVSRIENGKVGITQSKLDLLFNRYGWHPSQILGKENISSKIPIIGDVGAGAKIYPIDDLPLMVNGMREKDEAYINCEFVDSPPGTYPVGITALRVRGDSMLPFMPDGTVVYYEQRTSDCSSNIGRLCVVKLTDGSAMLKTLRRGYQYARFNLESYNMALIEDAELEWCAKIIFIKPI